MNELPAWDLRCGPWQRALADVAEVDALIVDAPYSARTHSKQRHGRRDEEADLGYASARGIGYAPMSEADVVAFVSHWGPRTRGWFCSITDSELYPAWRDALRADGRVVFAPIPIVQVGMNVRLAGDGPSSWTCWLVVARPRTAALAKWGTLPGAYIGNPFDAGERSDTASRRSSVIGSKPLWLMRAIVADYSRRGDLVCDPCAGGATTLLAAYAERRRSIGAELDPDTFERAHARLEARAGSLPLLSLQNQPSSNDNGGGHGDAA